MHNSDFIGEQSENKESILDRVMSSQTAEEIANFDPTSILNLLFNDLSDREKQVIVHRYGLAEGEAETLEDIGRLFNVTRERVRQIENSTIRKLKNNPQLENHLKPVENMVMNILEENGGIMRDDNLFDKILAYGAAKNINRAATSFIISKLLDHKLERVSKNEKIHDSWKLPTAELDLVEEVIDNLTDVLANKSEPLSKTYLLDAIKRRPVAQKFTNKWQDNVLENILDLTTKVDANPFDEWGLADWRSIKPKRMNDKIYLVMKKQGKPMHFAEIAKAINEAGFDEKKAYPATIHNELILDDKYVLVGRGIYALKEWGYQPGVVADVIESILRKAGGPLTKDEIVSKVLAERMVKKSTIQLALMNKQRFSKVERNKYWLTA